MTTSAFCRPTKNNLVNFIDQKIHIYYITLILHVILRKYLPYSYNCIYSKCNCIMQQQYYYLKYNYLEKYFIIIIIYDRKNKGISCIQHGFI